MPYILKMNFSDDEYSQLKTIAEEKNISIQDHIRSLLFEKDTIFCPEEAEKRALEYSEKNEFTLSDLYKPEEWDQISVGEKGVFGRKFFNYVESKKGEIRFLKLKNRRAYYYRESK